MKDIDYVLQSLASGSSFKGNPESLPHSSVFTALGGCHCICGASSIKVIVAPEEAACRDKLPPVTQWLSCNLGSRFRKRNFKKDKKR